MPSKYEAQSKTKLVHGDHVCISHCEVCDGIDHHWLERYLDPEDEDDMGHPAFKSFHQEMIMVCKHCPAWREIDDEADYPDFKEDEEGATD